MHLRGRLCIPRTRSSKTGARYPAGFSRHATILTPNTYELRGKFRGLHRYAGSETCRDIFGPFLKAWSLIEENHAPSISRNIAPARKEAKPFLYLQLNIEIWSKKPGTLCR